MSAGMDAAEFIWCDCEAEICLLLVMPSSQAKYICLQIGIFNHTSWVDSIILMWLFAPSGVALDFNARIPVVGTCIRAFQNIYVPRAAPSSASKAAASTSSQRPASTSSQRPSVANLIKER